MNAKAYKPGNRFSDRITVAQAAIEWQGLTPEQQSLVVVDDGLPYLAGVQDLTDRAEALIEAAGRGKITGLTSNEDGYPLQPAYMSLDKASVLAFTDTIESKAAAVQFVAAEDSFMQMKDVYKRLGVGRSTMYRWLEDGKFEAAHAEEPPRWRKSYVDAQFLLRTAAKKNPDI